RKHRPYLPREVQRVARAQHLISDDAELLALPCQPQHRLDEVPLALARGRGDSEETRDAEDHRPLAALERPSLAGELRFAVGAQRMGLVGLEIRCALAAVEDVVRREVDEGRAER